MQQLLLIEPGPSLTVPHFGLILLGTADGGPGTYAFNRSEDFSFNTGIVAADGDIIEIAHVDDVILAVINNVEITSDPIATGVDPAAGHRIFFSARDTAVLFNDVAFTTGGQPGAGAPLLSIQTTADAYTYDGDGAASPSTQALQAEAHLSNLTGTASWTVTAYDSSNTSLGSVGYTSVGNVITVDTATNVKIAYPTWSYLVLVATLSTHTDQQSIVRLTNGSDAVTPYLTNDAATVAAASDGTVASFAGTGGTMELFKGAIRQTSGVVYSVASSDPALTISINSSTGAYTISNLSADQGVATLRAHFNGVDYDKIYSIAKSKSGINAPLLALTSTAQTVTFDSSGNPVPSSQSITIEAVLQNIIGTATWTATAYTATSVSLGAITLGGSGNVRTLSNSQFTAPGATAYAVITASMAGLSDTETIVKLTQGSDAITALLTNESATVQADSSGTVTGGFGGVGGNFKVYRGTTDISTGSSVAYSVVSSSGVTISINPTSGAYTISGMSADQGTATLRATLGTTTYDKIYTIAKSKAGAPGATGATGGTGGTGPTGPGGSTLAVLTSTSMNGSSTGTFSTGATAKLAPGASASANFSGDATYSSGAGTRNVSVQINYSINGTWHTTTASTQFGLNGGGPQDLFFNFSITIPNSSAFAVDIQAQIVVTTTGSGTMSWFWQDAALIVTG
jgi:hypothetical protein